MALGKDTPVGVVWTVQEEGADHLDVSPLLPLDLAEPDPVGVGAENLLYMPGKK